MRWYAKAMARHETANSTGPSMSINKRAFKSDDVLEQSGSCRQEALVIAEKHTANGSYEYDLREKFSSIPFFFLQRPSSSRIVNHTTIIHSQSSSHYPRCDKKTSKTQNRRKQSKTRFWHALSAFISWRWDGHKIGRIKYVVVCWSIPVITYIRSFEIWVAERACSLKPRPICSRARGRPKMARLRGPHFHRFDSSSARGSSLAMCAPSIRPF